MKVLIMCKSLTNAQRCALLLERRGISASVGSVSRSRLGKRDWPSAEIRPSVRQTSRREARISERL